MLVVTGWQVKKDSVNESIGYQKKKKFKIFIVYFINWIS